MLGPERRHPRFECRGKINAPEIIQNVPGFESNFITLVIRVFAWPIAVETSEITEHVSVVLGLGIEAVHHQLWQGQGSYG